MGMSWSETPKIGPKVMKLENSLKLKIKRNVSASSQSLCFILSLRMNSSFTTSGPGFLALKPKYQLNYKRIDRNL